jgi:uncharacterized protein YkwD
MGAMDRTADSGSLDLQSLTQLVVLICFLFSVLCLNFILAYRAEAISSQQDPAAQSTSEYLREAPPPVQSHAAPYSELVMSIHQQVNDLRRAQRLKPLTLNPVLSVQAKEHSVDMARNGSTVSHRGFAERLREIQKKLPYRAGAENVAANMGYENPAREAVESWKNSQGHRNNMLGDYDLTGIGVARNAQGHYFFTQIFLRQ